MWLITDEECSMHVADYFYPDFDTLSLPESIMVTCKVVLTFEAADEILGCDHSNETSSAVLSFGTICLSIFCKKKFGMFLDFWFWTVLGVKGLNYSSVQCLPKNTSCH